MVPRLTIQPDGSVSMCALQPTDMDARDLLTQVVGRVRTINSGAKDGAGGDDRLSDRLPAGGLKTMIWAS